ncbi:MAG: hypothetical protein DHS20C13_22200 [Thermodesulfobacteriota bacterium]|nr:MAG: hypothetical protein DHS20C13_22200 [Thermodesulfobacteriota bacterium]
MHTTVTNSFNYLGYLFQKDEYEAIDILINLSECDEVGLGNSKTKQGKKIGKALAHKALSSFRDIPQIQKQGFTHFEQIQLLVNGFSKDRVSDIACNIIKSFLIDYTIQNCRRYGIPTEKIDISFFDAKKYKIIQEQTNLPVHPHSKNAILLVPKRWLRFVPWINFDDYFKNYLADSQKLIQGRTIDRVELLDYNRRNYDQVQTYVALKQRTHKDCKNDPLFTQIPVLSAKRKKDAILKLPTGKTDNADQDYEKYLCPLLASMLYPELDFAQPQSRTDSGILIRDLIFYNNTSHPLLNVIFESYGSKQIVFELKNVLQLNTTHINQLNRYLSTEFGSFGIIFTRNRPPKNVYKNTIDLWSGQRKCILILDDQDLKFMCQVFESKQRSPIDVINKKYVQFKRDCPS